MVTLQSPRVAVAAGEGVSVSGYGHAWYLLEREYGLPFTGLRVEGITGQLAEYDVLILPPGRAYSLMRPSMCPVAPLMTVSSSARTLA